MAALIEVTECSGRYGQVAVMWPGMLVDIKRACWVVHGFSAYSGMHP